MGRSPPFRRRILALPTEHAHNRDTSSVKNQSLTSLVGMTIRSAMSMRGSVPMPAGSMNGSGPMLIGTSSLRSCPGRMFRLRQDGRPTPGCAGPQADVSSRPGTASPPCLGRSPWPTGGRTQQTILHEMAHIATLELCFGREAPHGSVSCFRSSSFTQPSWASMRRS